MTGHATHGVASQATHPTDPQRRRRWRTPARAATTAALTSALLCGLAVAPSPAAEAPGPLTPQQATRLMTTEAQPPAPAPLGPLAAPQLSTLAASDGSNPAPFNCPYIVHTRQEVVVNRWNAKRRTVAYSARLTCSDRGQIGSLAVWRPAADVPWPDHVDYVMYTRQGYTIAKGVLRGNQGVQVNRFAGHLSRTRIRLDFWFRDANGHWYGVRRYIAPWGT